ncbi:MAG TPA: hypothetical protein VLA19_09760, partial [Herpetosiphonaceae bacterium]|nr:hypothetical protein [Herpetosiphonaceae bacterium]
RRFLAWRSVRDDAASLNLDEAQRKQCDAAIDGGDKTVAIQLENAYLWLLAPRQEGTASIEWDPVRLSTGNDLSANGTVLQRASYRAVIDEHLITRWSPKLLQVELGRYRLWPEDAPHIGVRQLWGYFATYVYLPRLRDREVLLATIRAGAASTDYFGYATGVDSGGNYQGLHFGRQPATVYDDEASVLVKPDAAREALSRQEAARTDSVATIGGTGTLGQPTSGGASGIRDDGGIYTGAPGSVGRSPNGVTEAQPTTFFGSVQLDPLRLSGSAGQIGSEVVQHLVALLGADVKVRLEIEGNIPGGVPENVVRIVTENASTLKFRMAEFSD